MDLSIKNSFKHMKNIWIGEEPKITERSACSYREDNMNESSFLTLPPLVSIDGLKDPFILDDHDFFQKLQRSLEKEFKTNTSSQGNFNLYSPFYEEEMASMTGTYQHQRNENLDEYFKSLGVPYIPRKMMTMSSPRLEITNEDEKWTIRTITLMRTMESTFALGEEFEETMPSGDVLKNTASIDGDSLTIVSIAPNDNKITRRYDFTEDGVVLTMTNENGGQVAKRFFKRTS